MRLGLEAALPALEVHGRRGRPGRCCARRRRLRGWAVFLALGLMSTFEPLAGAADIVPQDSVHISVRRAGSGGSRPSCPGAPALSGGSCYDIVLDGSYSAGDVLTVLAQAGTSPCLSLDTEEGRVSVQKARRGVDAGAGFDAWYLGARGGRYSETWAWEFPAGDFLVCAYLGRRTVVASASQDVTVGRYAPPSSGGVVSLAPYDLVYLGRSGLACYAFPKIFPDDRRLSTPRGLNCYLGRPGAPIDVGLGSAAMYADGRSGSSTAPRGVSGGAQALLTFSSLACSTRICTRARRVPVRNGTLLSVQGENIACIYDARSHWDRAGGPGVECYATSGRPRLMPPGRVGNVVLAASRTAYVKFSFAGQPAFYPSVASEELFGVSGFFLDHRIVAGIAARRGRSVLAYVRHVCTSYASSCRSGMAR